MKFFKAWAVCMVVLFVFFFFGGHMALDFKRNPAIALTVIALVPAALICVLMKMSDRIDTLEAEIKELKKQISTSESEDTVS